ncbi:uncharacterized protein HD556DRAFT_1249025, partial [Suillus plorans]
NLTLSNWLTVVRYYDNNQPISQKDVIKHFKNLPQGALRFTQSSLSHHITAKGYSNGQAHLSSNTTALSEKRAWIVTQPDVKKALILWIGHIEQKHETVTDPMLMAKHAKFEEVMDIPEDERSKRVVGYNFTVY